MWSLYMLCVYMSVYKLFIYVSCVYILVPDANWCAVVQTFFFQREFECCIFQTSKHRLRKIHTGLEIHWCDSWCDNKRLFFMLITIGSDKNLCFA